MKRVLVTVAHPDDEVLGCGGTIAKHVQNGDVVDLVVFTNGVGARSFAGKAEEIVEKNARLASLHAVTKILGITNVTCFDFEDNQMDNGPLLSIVKSIEKVIKSSQPHLIYTHFHGDLNIDHQIVHRAVMTACRPSPNSSVREILGFEVLSSSEWVGAGKEWFVPCVFNDISEQLDTKIQALHAYKQEMFEAPHSRSIENAKALARLRGHTVGLEAAEAFVEYRRIN